jgi:ribosomal protein S27AE
MPEGVVGRGPALRTGSCPTCNGTVEMAFYEKQNVQRFFCDWCGQRITAELKDGKLFVTKGANYTPIRKDEICPNCGSPWELWFHPNGTVGKLHGALSIASGNNVKCAKCGTLAVVSLH